uniref:Cardiolipin synthase n=1 Tax=Timema cristinae TaxID=61476 RepID=A0A7R9DQJ6_TIMCR|nr:unnamed protein product [Timema cristinae]
MASSHLAEDQLLPGEALWASVRDRSRLQAVPKEMGPDTRTLSRYFDVTYATAQLAPTTISKVNTAVQLLMVASTLAAPVFNYVDHSLLHMLWYITAGTTITSAVSYLVTKDTYKFFKPSK